MSNRITMDRYEQDEIEKKAINFAQLGINSLFTICKRLLYMSMLVEVLD